VAKCNGGTAGVISYSAMRLALDRGYATASTDTGHVSSGSFDSSWALNRPDLIADFGHRGLHVMTVNGKDISRAFYGKGADYSYYVGCSKGGQQGLMEAQRYPDDYDGIIAGDPANNWTRFYAGSHLWYSIATLKDPESYIPASKTQILGDAVTAACDALDGIKDGVLDDPRRCKFDPAVLTCKQGQDPATCFTPKQVKAIKDIWSGVRTSDGTLVHRPLVPGGEAGPGGWAAWTTGSAPFTGLHWQAADGFFRFMVFSDPNRNVLNFDYDKDLAFALQKVGPVLDANDPDLRPFERRGGKMIVYHGFSDLTRTSRRSTKSITRTWSRSTASATTTARKRWPGRGTSSVSSWCRACSTAPVVMDPNCTTVIVRLGSRVRRTAPASSPCSRAARGRSPAAPRRCTSARNARCSGRCCLP
jgi:feruloyl esterase